VPSWSTYFIKDCLTIESFRFTQSTFIAGRAHVLLYQIRGTPACGKTILCNLLHRHLKKQNVRAYTIQGWKTGGHYKQKLQEICGDFHPTHPTCLLFDEGQDTYRDHDLWNHFFKQIRSMGNMHVVLFCCYGSSSSQIVAPTHGSNIIEPPDSGTPDVFAEQQRLSLLPTTDTPLGLFMSDCEFEEFLRRYPHPLNIADDVKREILKWSAGHVGGIEYLLDSIRRGVRFHCSKFGICLKRFARTRLQCVGEPCMS
jgi:hypothetical protein